MYYSAEAYYSIAALNVYQTTVIFPLSIITYLISIGSFNPSKLISLILFLTLIIPYNYIFFLDISPRDFIQIDNLMFLNFCFMLFVIFSKYSLKKHISLFMLSKNLFEIFIHLISILAFLSLIYLYGGSFEFSFDLAYDRRFNSREVVQGGSSIAYFLSFYGGAIIPISAVYGIIYKKPIFVIYSIVGALLFFGSSGGKGVLFSSFLSIALAIAFKFSKKIGLICLAGLSLVFLLSYIEFILFDLSISNLYMFRRMFFTPAYYSLFYFDYFQINEFYYMKDSWINFFNSDEVEKKARLIGAVYQDDPQANINTNIWATSFADFGKIGMLVVTIFALFFSWILNSLYLLKNKVIVISFSVFVGIVFSQGAFHTALLSNGLLPGIILLSMMRSEYDN